MGLSRLKKTRKRARIIGTLDNGKAIPSSGKTLGARGIQAYREQGSRDLEEKLRMLNPEEIRDLEALRDTTFESGNDASAIHEWHDDDTDTMDIGEILDGSADVDLSHEGGEFLDLIEDYFRQQRRRKDTRVRDNRTESRNRAFMADIEGISDAYLAWYASLGEMGLGNSTPSSSERPEQGVYTILVVDTYDTQQANVSMREGDSSIAASFLRQGLVPCSPFSPTVAVTVRVLELFRNISLRSPRLSIQSFVKSLCDLHSVPFRAYLSNQFSICVDLYLSIINVVDRRVQSAIGRNSPKWRLRHACPACTYRLKDEPKLQFSMLTTMDGNDSLKHIQRRQSSTVTESSDHQLGVPNERLDTREVEGDYYIPRCQVDRWAKEVVSKLLAEGYTALEPSTDTSPNLCEDRWKNMANELVARMWGIFDETGIFLSLCRHGFVLVVADMVKSGELSKYPLAVVEILLEAFGNDIGGGYDIGCQFSTTLNSSPLGKKAKEMNYRSLVGSFHGHAHNRLCQLKYLATYVKGLGLEDLEGCERMFSKSNNLASSLRHASTFHRRQRIQGFFKHMDENETYQGLSMFLVNNYKQAIEILSGENAFRKQMADQGITSFETFEIWLKEEREYLEGLRREPLPETLTMEYLKNLMNLETSRQSREAAVAAWQMNTVTYTGNDSAHDDLSATRKAETARRHAHEKELKYLSIVQELEVKLGVTQRWTPDDPEWKNAEQMTIRRKYQRCLDTLEGLVVSRMFELTKMNMSQTGYKMRKHIGNALKTRSAAIRTALEHYNQAARALTPPRAELSWDSVVEYAFLADFDLLADTREDVRLRPWARPAARELRDRYFKMERAREEIERLNVEIPRLATYIRDEEQFLLEQEQELMKAGQLSLAVQVNRRRRQLLNFNDVHLHRFERLQKLSGFSGSIAPGTALEPMQCGTLQTTLTSEPLEPHSVQSSRQVLHSENLDGCSDDGSGLEDDADADDEVYTVVEITAQSERVL